MDCFFSENTGLYFFSALLQANAAILAIVGVFMIFRLQSYQSEKMRIEEKIIPFYMERGSFEAFKLLSVIVNDSQSFLNSA